MNDCKIIKDKLLTKELLRSLTLDERNTLTAPEERPAVKGSIDKYASIPSKANIEKVVKKNNSERLSEIDYYMAFYNFDDDDINQKMKSYIEQQDWFIFMLDALCDFEPDVSNSDSYLYSNYNMAYTTAFMTNYMRKKLVEHITKLNNISVSSVVIEKILNHATNGCLHIHCKSVIYDYYVNKQNYVGDKKFFRYIKDNFGKAESIIDCYLKYPVIIRRLGCKMLNILQYYKKVFTDIDSIYDELCEKRFINSNVIIDITCGEGDTHECGKTVAMLRFGENEILYKPRELEISRKFFSFINAINQKTDIYKLPVIKSIWHDDFTIEEKITYKTCTSEAEIKRFYIRTGYILAILYLLNGNDIHYENIIANGEYPCIIDLETMFAHATEQMESSGSAIEKAIYKINHSVKSCHLLPSYIFSKGNNNSADVSGLGGKKAKLPEEKLVLTNWDSDDICFEMKELYLGNHSNIPKLNDERVDYRNYIDEIITGFEELMHIFILNKEFFKEQIRNFSGVKTRQVLKATNDYGYMLEFASHPNYTKDMICFERFLDAVWVFPYKKPHIAKCEAIDLLNDDVPIFYCDSDSNNIVSSRDEVIADVYEVSGIDAAVKRIDELSEGTTKTQTLYIMDTLGILNTWLDAERKKTTDKYRFSSEVSEIDIPTVWESKLSGRIVDILKNSALIGNYDISWIAVKNRNAVTEPNAVSNIPSGMADGLAGIMYYLYSDNNASSTELIKKIAGSFGKVRDMSELQLPISGASGFASILMPMHTYSSAESGKQTNQDVFGGMLSWCEKQLDTQENIDYSELASALMVFTSLYAESENYRYLSLMNKAAEILTSSSKTYINKSSYMIREKIALALLEANEHLEDENVTELINMIRKLDEPFYKSGKFTESQLLTDVSQYYRLCTYITKQCKIDKALSVDNVILNSIEYTVNNIEEYDPSILLKRVDMLLEYQEMPEAKEMCRKELERLIIISGLTEDDYSYDTIVNGLSLDSLLCGLGMRIKRYLGIIDKLPCCIY